MQGFRNLFLFTLAVLTAGCSSAQLQERSADPSPLGAAVDRPELGRHFGEVEGTFVLLSARTGEVIRYNPERARTRFLPASTFKIPNTLIALETAAASGPEDLLVRDSVLAPREAWWPASWVADHTLRTAFPSSVVWYYQELARRIGPRRMQAHLDRFGYGNRDASGGIDRFWLNGGLAISAEEQVEFLRRFHEGELGVSDRSTRIVKELLVLEDTPDYRLSGKTGWAGLGEAGARQVGWLVGFLERDEDVYYFATNIEIRAPEDARARLVITLAVLGELGLLGPDPARVREVVDAAIRPLLAPIPRNCATAPSARRHAARIS